jgi:ferric-dicitrate binding protein FerR (iron transport regulator)
MMFLAHSPLVQATEGGSKVLGTVVGMGDSRMKAALDRWVPVDEKSRPVVDGTALKTEKGSMSIIMKDGVSIDMSKGTDLLVGGITSNYSMRLQSGSITFKVYEGIGLTVTTPSTTVVVQRVSATSANSRRTFKDEISGIITHDGKETQVICLRGKFGVVPANAETRVLTEGNTVAVGSPEVSGQTQYATTATVSVPDVPTTTAAVYESPNAFGSTTTLLKEVETGGQEVVSEKTP